MTKKQKIPEKEPDEVFESLIEALEVSRLHKERRRIEKRIENEAAGRPDPDQAIFYFHSSGVRFGCSDATINLYSEYVVRSWNWDPSDGERRIYHHTQRFPFSEEILSKIRNTLESLRGELNYSETVDGSVVLASRDYDLYITDHRVVTVLDVLEEIKGWKRSVKIQSPANLVTPEHDDYDFFFPSLGPHDGTAPSWVSEMRVRARYGQRRTIR